ncbi:hypothetical protein EJ04DRAFT_131248 [Polyplosphaeria fusca]|uniref:Secreted protein n=1 Tax=Polyplosphaeria fusca TaxID=682080 RepID=A0A9P4QMK4_9PLEO|nr:hypothetical protein EJ04DRAFT_131248 [Polyplosphaeria fusca]
MFSFLLFCMFVHTTRASADVRSLLHGEMLMGNGQFWLPHCTSRRSRAGFRGGRGFLFSLIQHGMEGEAMQERGVLAREVLRLPHLFCSVCLFCRPVYTQFCTAMPLPFIPAPPHCTEMLVMSCRASKGHGAGTAQSSSMTD